jgi:hypothetical protein
MRSLPVPTRFPVERVAAAGPAADLVVTAGRFTLPQSASCQSRFHPLRPPSARPFPLLRVSTEQGDLVALRVAQAANVEAFAVLFPEARRSLVPTARQHPRRVQLPYLAVGLGAEGDHRAVAAEAGCPSKGGRHRRRPDRCDDRRGRAASRSAFPSNVPVPSRAVEGSGCRRFRPAGRRPPHHRVAQHVGSFPGLETNALLGAALDEVRP